MLCDATAIGSGDIRYGHLKITIYAMQVYTEFKNSICIKGFVGDPCVKAVTGQERRRQAGAA